MTRTPPPRQTTAAEMAAFEAVCERLAGFDDALTTEAVDGGLCALAAAPRRSEPSEWLPALFGDAFERAFADPDDHARALQALQTRLAALQDQLDPQALFDDPETLRVQPWLGEWTDEQRRQLVDDKVVTADEALALQTGAIWAEGFLDAVQALPGLWTEPEDEEAAALFGQAFDQIAALMIPPGSDDWREHVREHWPDAEPDRDDLVAEACMSLQDLRMFWVDAAPRPPPRRVAPAPGRNDPCPCGSGKKFKKCHGA